MNLIVFPWIVLSVLLLSAPLSPAEPLNLPNLGDGASSIVSLREEQATGQAWLRAFRRQAPIQHDPLVTLYLDELVQRLLLHSEVAEKQFSLVVVDSKSFNAFAVPGNIIGLNMGLFTYAETEDELAGVIAHELAHLSQRHYARSVDRQKAQNLATLAAMLGSLVIMAKSGGDAGMAAMSATQAAAIQSQLTYSRTQEQEADRVGMETLNRAQMNPQAIADMFEHMVAVTRYRKDLKQFDFLLTHPLSEDRVADALNQARELPLRSNSDNLAFHLAKAYATFLTQKNPQQAADYFRNQRRSAKFPEASDYGLAISLLSAGKIDEAAPIIHSLYSAAPYQSAYILARLDLLARQKKNSEADQLITHHLELSPLHFAVSMKAAEYYLATNRPQRAVNLLRPLAAAKAGKPEVWYLLAESEGLAGNIPEVHLARTEYFLLYGDFTQAKRHLTLAQTLLKENTVATARIEARLKEVEEMEKEQKF